MPDAARRQMTDGTKIRGPARLLEGDRRRRGRGRLRRGKGLRGRQGRRERGSSEDRVRQEARQAESTSMPRQKRNRSKERENAGCAGERRTARGQRTREEWRPPDMVGGAWGSNIHVAAHVCRRNRLCAPCPWRLMPYASFSSEDEVFQGASTEIHGASTEIHGASTEIIRSS
jgi:hypothetical protein